jgi:hypothetical protein
MIRAVRKQDGRTGLKKKKAEIMPKIDEYTTNRFISCALVGINNCEKKVDLSKEASTRELVDAHHTPDRTP